jgi:hypothetical protein
MFPRLHVSGVLNNDWSIGEKAAAENESAKRPILLDTFPSMAGSLDTYASHFKAFLDTCSSQLTASWQPQRVYQRPREIRNQNSPLTKKNTKTSTQATSRSTISTTTRTTRRYDPSSYIPRYDHNSRNHRTLYAHVAACFQGTYLLWVPGSGADTLPGEEFILSELHFPSFHLFLVSPWFQSTTILMRRTFLAWWNTTQRGKIINIRAVVGRENGATSWGKTFIQQPIRDTLFIRFVSK